MSRIYADFHNADSFGRVRLNCAGTIEDLSKSGQELREGLALSLYADDADAQGQPDELLVDGIVTYSHEEKCWVAVVDWSAIRHVSQIAESRAIVVTEPLHTATAPTVVAPR